MAQDLVLSASSVTTFLMCGQKWWFVYVAGVKAPPSLRAIRGIAAHAAVEVDMRQKMTTRVDLPVTDMLDAYDTSWGEETVDGYAITADEKPGEVKDKGYELVRLYHTEVAPKIQPIMVEEPIQFSINEQAYSGQIDLGELVSTEQVWGPPEERLVIRDTKTTGRTPPEGGGYLLNMTGYAIAQRQKTGLIEADTVLDYLVALKEPKYKEIRMGGPVTDAQIAQFANIVSSVAASIKAERYVPNGLVNGSCSWCQFRTICPAYQNPP